jgi:hypothetical protein
MYKMLNGAIIALGFATVTLAASGAANAKDVVGVHVGDVGLGLTIGNGHYYDRDHHRQAYTYPSDWKTYHHPQSWYQSHSRWNDQKDHDYYRN